MISSEHAQPYHMEITHNGYKNTTVNSVLTSQKPLRIPIHVSDSHGWYDFTLKVRGHDGYQVNYAGHFENGKESNTDPVMGGIMG